MTGQRSLAMAVGFLVVAFAARGAEPEPPSAAALGWLTSLSGTWQGKAEWSGGRAGSYPMTATDFGKRHGRRRRPRKGRRDGNDERLPRGRAGPSHDPLLRCRQPAAPESREDRHGEENRPVRAGRHDGAAGRPRWRGRAPRSRRRPPHDSLQLRGGKGSRRRAVGPDEDRSIGPKRVTAAPSRDRIAREFNGVVSANARSAEPGRVRCA